MKFIPNYQCRSASPTAGTAAVSAAAPTSAAGLRVSRWACARPTISAVCTSSEDIGRKISKHEHTSFGGGGQSDQSTFGIIPYNFPMKSIQFYSAAGNVIFISLIFKKIKIHKI